MGLFEQLIECLDTSRVRRDEPMANHTTFRVGGPAQYYAMPASTKELIACIELAIKNQTPYLVIGNGSNLLVSDTGYEGLVLAMGKHYAKITQEGEETLYAQAGATLAMLAHTAKEASLTGLEFAAGIPGTLGGACLMNAGAYGGEMKNVLVQVETVDAKGQLHIRKAQELDLGYRYSKLMETGEIVTGATLRLAKGEKETIASYMEDLATRRREKQPLEYPSAGSTFKRPEGYFAGALIEQAGLKGKGVGGAAVSTKHAGFVVNMGNATAKDIYDTITMVQSIVREQNQVELVPEVRFVGCFS